MSDAKGYVKSLEKGLSVLKAMSRDQFELPITEIARAAEMTPSTAHRYISTLVSLGYVSQSGQTRMYRLTARILELGFATLRSLGIRKRVLPHLLEIARQYNITTACSVLDGAEIIYIERVRSANLVNLDLSTGSRLPAYATSMGKVMLAFQEDEALNRLIEGITLIPLTPYTITNKDVLRTELHGIRRAGYAACRQELSLGLESIAAPIFSDHEVEAAISFNLPPVSEEEKPDVEAALLNRLLQLAGEMSIG